MKNSRFTIAARWKNAAPDEFILNYVFAGFYRAVSRRISIIDFGFKGRA